jgi:hypothetical protein
MITRTFFSLLSNAVECTSILLTLKLKLKLHAARRQILLTLKLKL